MFKMVYDLLFSQFLGAVGDDSNPSNKPASVKTKIIVALTIVFSLSVLKYVETYLDVQKFESQHAIERPQDILQLKLEHCTAMLDLATSELEQCQANVYTSDIVNGLLERAKTAEVVDKK